MFYDVTKETKEYIVSQGGIEFIPAVKWKGSSNPAASCIKYEIIFRHNEGEKDELGNFYLTLRKGLSYEMAKLEFTVRCGKGLRLFMFELILKHAIKQAKIADVGILAVECTDSLIADAFLTCHFKVEEIKQVATSTPVYRGLKILDEEKTHPLIGFSLGIGCP